MYSRRESPVTPKFEYRKRTIEDVERRANRSTSEYDSMFLISVRNFKARQGENRVRFLPATWPDSDHYAFDIWSHREIGADRNRYLCRKKMLDKSCCICDEVVKLQREGASKDALAIRATPRSIAWVIDRFNEDAGPVIWEMSPRQDKGIAALQRDRRTGTIFLCEDPEEGYDLSFDRKGELLKTEYIGYAFDRASSPMSEDVATMTKWWEFIKENPIPDILKFYENDYISSIFNSEPLDKEEEVERVPLRRVARPVTEVLDDEIIDTPRPSRRPAIVEPAPEEDLGEPWEEPTNGKANGREPEPEEDMAATLRKNLRNSRMQDRRTP